METACFFEGLQGDLSPKCLHSLIWSLQKSAHIRHMVRRV
jgi:hypothetical protein